jgi:hypothetical protein
LRAAERFPIEFDVEAFGGEETLLLGDKVIEPHAFRGDGHRSQGTGHGDSSSSFSLGPPSLSCVFLAHSERPVIEQHRRLSVKRARKLSAQAIVAVVAVVERPSMRLD